MQGVVVHANISSCTAVANFSTNRHGECQAGYRSGSSVDRNVDVHENDPSSNPELDSFSLCCFDDL